TAGRAGRTGPAGSRDRSSTPCRPRRAPPGGSWPRPGRGSGPSRRPTEPPEGALSWQRRTPMIRTLFRLLTLIALAAAPATALPPPWTPIGPFGGAVQSLTADPKHPGTV